MKLRGKLVIVTGSSRGIGKSISKTLAISGIKIIAIARNIDAVSDHAMPLINLEDKPLR